MEPNRLADPQAGQPDLELSRQLLSSSSTMIGICTTLIGLVKLFEVRMGASRVDEYGGLAALLFLISATASYLSVRNAPHPRVSAGCARLADISFMLGLVSLSAISLLFAYEVI